MQVGFATSDAHVSCADTLTPVLLELSKGKGSICNLRQLNRWPWTTIQQVETFLTLDGFFNSSPSSCPRVPSALFSGVSVTVPRASHFTNMSTSKAATEPRLGTISYQVCAVSCCAVARYPLLCLTHHLYSQWSLNDMKRSRIVI